MIELLFFFFFNVSSTGIYHQITRFIQGYVDNEINLNADKSCSKTCTDYKNTKNYGCAENTLCAESYIDEASTRCKGTIYNCDYVDDDLTVCPVAIFNFYTLTHKEIRTKYGS